uniref:HECT domain-containing protein n=1 Tax=Schistocephalus solidus TaxID=70667 RepID=A0A183T222_SCHSO
LGDGTSTSRATPRIIISFGKRRAFQVACGSSHSFVIIRDPYSSGAAKITTTTVAESACTSIFPRKYSETPRTRHDGSLLAAAVHVDTHLPPAFLGPLPSRGPPPEYHALNNLVLRTQATANSIRPLVLLRNRFLFLQWVAKLTCGGEYSRSAADNADPIMGGVTLVNSTLIGSRLQTSAFFGFWPLIGQVVGDGLSTDRLAALISPSPLHSDLVTVDNRLDMLASLLLEILLRRILQSTTHPALFHGPEIRVTRLSTNLDRSDIPHLRSYRDPRSDATAREPVNPLKSVFAQVSRRMLQMNEFGAPCSNEDPDGVVGACEPVVAEEEMREASHLHRARAWLANQLTAGRPTLIPRPPRLQVPPQPHFWLSRRAWKVSLVGESVDDCGGGFSDSVAEICDELHAPWSGLPVLVPCSPLTESGRIQEIAPSSNFIINPDCAVLAPAWLVFLGCLMGIGVRTGHSLHLRLAQPIWRLLCGRRSGIRLSEMISLDAEVSATGFDLLAIAKMPNEELERAELPFTCLSANRCHSVDLIQFVRELAFCSQPCIETDCLHLFLSKSTNHSPTPPPSSAPDVLWSSVQASARVALSEFMSAPAVSMEMTEPPTPNASEACPGARLCVKPDTRPAYLMAVRRGLAQVLPIGVLSLFTGEELECLVCGAPEISVEALQQLVTYDNLAPDDQLVLWFWTIVSEMTNWERSLLLRFVWGRSRLPRFPSDLRERQFHIRVQMDYHPPDSYLPEGSTCLFTLRLPQYSSLAVFRERLRYAIFSCRSIDSDDLTMLE